MALKVPERLRWAVEVLEVQPDDQIMEIGCGHGVAAALVCEHLTDGRLTAIDRSAKMIKVATERNQDCIMAGKASFHIVDLNRVDMSEMGAAHFNKIFAVHVNVFWLKPTNELGIIRQLLAPDGALYLFYEPFEVRQNQETTDKVIKVLDAHRFSSRVIFKNPDIERGVCIVAKPADPST